MRQLISIAQTYHSLRQIHLYWRLELDKCRPFGTRVIFHRTRHFRAGLSYSAPLGLGGCNFRRPDLIQESLTHGVPESLTQGIR